MCISCKLRICTKTSCHSLTVETRRRYTEHRPDDAATAAADDDDVATGSGHDKTQYCYVCTQLNGTQCDNNNTLILILITDTDRNLIKLSMLTHKQSDLVQCYHYDVY